MSGANRMSRPYYVLFATPALSLRRSAVLGVFTGGPVRSSNQRRESDVTWGFQPGVSASRGSR